MKKLLALLLVVLMAVSVTACVPTPGNINDLVNDAINDLENEVVDNIEDNFNDDDNDDIIDNNDDDDDNTDETFSVDFGGNFTSQVVYDKNNIKVTAEEMTYEEYYGPTISLLVENNSSKNINVSAKDTTVNNIVFNTYFYVDINAGKKSYEDMYFYESDLKTCGIDKIGTIEFVLEIDEQETYDDIDKSGVISLVLDNSVSLAPAPKGDKIYSKNGVTVYSEACKDEDDDYYDYVTRFFVVNESDKYVTVSCQDVSVNGFMVDPYCSVSVPAGKMAYQNMYFYISDLEDNKIKNIEEVEFIFNVYDYNTYDNIDKSETITIKAN